MTTYTRFINGEFEKTLYDSENLKQSGIQIDSSYVEVKVAEQPKFSIYKKTSGYDFLPWEDKALQIWIEEDRTRDEILEEIDSGERPYEIIKNAISKTIKEKLDKFVQERGYENILSACSYVSSSVEKFRLEAQFCISKRDEIWASIDNEFSKAALGERDRIVFFSDIEETLPELNWNDLA